MSEPRFIVKDATTIEDITKTTPSYDACQAIADEVEAHLTATLKGEVIGLDDARDGSIDLEFIHGCERRFRITFTEVEA